MLLYATPDDLEAWAPNLPEEDVEPFLRRASTEVRNATRAALYDVDSSGKPRDPSILEAFRDATCAQVAWWDKNSIRPGELPAPSVVASKSMGGRSVSYADSAVLSDQRLAASNGALCTESRDILANEQLLDGQPLIGGSRYGW